MKIRLMNMVKIKNPKNNEVVVLDKKKVYGWEGPTFPGGKCEEMESLTASVIREAKEETNLDIKNPKLLGTITWYYTENGEVCKDIGFLYETDEYSGILEENNREGKLCWQDYNEFLKSENKSDSMPEILKIYEKELTEIFWNLDNNEISVY